MPTVNYLLTQAWTKIISDVSVSWLASMHEQGRVEIAVTTLDQSPPADLHGHIITAGGKLGRGDLGPGYVWARADDAVDGVMRLVVTA